MIKTCGQIKSQSIGGSEVLYGVTVIMVDFMLGISFTLDLILLSPQSWNVLERGYKLFKYQYR